MFVDIATGKVNAGKDVLEMPRNATEAAGELQKLAIHAICSNVISHELFYELGGMKTVGEVMLCGGRVA
jgi:hypothetical protein